MKKQLILKQFGGSEEEFYKQYPTEEAYIMAMGGAPCHNCGEKQYVDMFKSVIKKALGGPAFPGQTGEDIIENKKKAFTGTLKNNLDEFMMEQRAKEMYSQNMQRMHGGLHKAQAGYEVEGSPENDAFWGNRQTSTVDQFAEEGSPESEASWNNRQSQCTDEERMDKGSLCYDPNFMSNSSAAPRQDSPRELAERRTPTDAMVHGNPFENAQGQKGSLNPDRQTQIQKTPDYASDKSWSFTTPSGTETATALMAGLTTATGMINNANSKKDFDKFKREHSDPNVFMPIVQTGDRGKLQNANWMFQGQTERPNMNGYQAQFQGNNYGAMGSPYYGEFGGAFNLDQKEHGGATNSSTNFWNASQLKWPGQSNEFSKPDIRVSNTLTAVPRDVANLEAEGGETAIVNQGGIPAHFNIQGKSHAKGGVPLNLPENSFIFSDTKALRIKDPLILAEFGMAVKAGGYSPADIAKKYNINKYRRILADSDSTDLQRETAEMMIANYNEKLAKLSLVQESKKGFPQGIPAISMPYIEMMNINPSDLVNTESQQEQPMADMAKFGGAFQQGGYTAPTFNVPLATGDEEAIRRKGDLQETIPAIQSILEAPQRAMMYAGTGMFGDEARFEMPSETLLRNHPNANPYLTAGLDVFADPLIVTGALKTAARSAVGKIGTSTVAHLSANLAEGVPFKKLQHQILTGAGKPWTKKNMAIAERTIQAATKKASGVDFSNLSPVKKAELLKKMEKEAIKVAGTERMVQDLGQAGRAAKTAAVATAKGIKKISGKIGEGVVEGAKYIAEKVPNVIENMNHPYVTPIMLPMAKNASGVLGKQVYQKIAKSKEEQYQQELEKNNLLQQQLLAMQGDKVFKKPSAPATKSITSVPDTTGLAEYERLLSNKQFGGELFEFDGGGGVNKEKSRPGFVAYNDGSVYNTNTKKWMIHTPEVDVFEEARKRRAGAKTVATVTPNPNLPVFDKPKVPTVTQPSAKPSVHSQYMPYGEDPLALEIMEQFKVKGAADLYGKKIGYQKKSDKGYGEDLTWEETMRDNPRFAKFLKDSKVTFNPKEPGHLAFFEKFHRDDSYNQVYSRLIKSGKSPEEAAKLANRVADQVSFINKPDDVRDADIKGGIWHRSRKELQFDDPIIEEEPRVAAERNPLIPATVIAGKRTREDAPWWLQDEIAVGAAAGNFMRVKKYAPWQAKSAAVLPDPNYLDPTRAYAANAEIANIGTQGLAAFANPQQFSAGFSQIQGSAMKNAADIGAQYDNANVQISNDFERERANILTQKSREDAGLATQLYDKYTIMNQQFDNAKGQRRDQMVNLVNNAITNRAYTQNMNSLFPQYHVGPQSGGLGYHTGVEKAFTPEVPGNDMKKTYDGLLEDYGNTEEGRKSALELMKLMYSKTA